MTNITENLLSYSYKFVEITELERQLGNSLKFKISDKIGRSMLTDSNISLRTQIWQNFAGRLRSLLRFNIIYS